MSDTTTSTNTDKRCKKDKLLVRSIMVVVAVIVTQISSSSCSSTASTSGSSGGANNWVLCGGPHQDPCLPSGSSTPENHEDDPNLDLFTHGFAIGYALCLAVVMILVVSFCDYNPKLLALKSSKKKRSRLPSHHDLMLSTLERLVTRMSFDGLREATSDFSNDSVIGFGKTGTMYKATLPNGWHLTVKRFYHPHHLKRQFVSELMTLGRFRHNNLVPLLGFCMHDQERLLVYKYMSNQSLYQWIHPQNHTNSKIIAWPLKFKIIQGVARGLAWLHHRCTLRVAHLNLTSKCILLDQKFEPKISNFGEALILNPKDIEFQSSRDLVISQELWEMGFLGKDVYDYGIVILELITGMDPIEVTKNLETFSLAVAEWNRNGCCMSVGSASRFLVDTVGIGLQGYEEEIFKVLGVACDCVELSAELRPTMLQVYRELRNFRERHGFQEDCDAC